MDAHGREPTVHELQQSLGWRPKQIRKMMRGFGAEAFTDMGTELEHDTQVEDPVQRVRGAILLMRSQLTDEQRRFADLHYPEEGQEQKSVSAIAKHLGMPEHRVYRIKKKVEAKIAPIIRGQ